MVSSDRLPSKSFREMAIHIQIASADLLVIQVLLCKNSHNILIAVFSICHYESVS